MADGMYVVIRFDGKHDYGSTRLFESLSEVFKFVVLRKEQLFVRGWNVSRAPNDEPFGADELLPGPG